MFSILNNVIDSVLKLINIAPKPYVYLIEGSELIMFEKQTLDNNSMFIGNRIIFNKSNSVVLFSPIRSSHPIPEQILVNNNFYAINTTGTIIDTFVLKAHILELLKSSI